MKPYELVARTIRGENDTGITPTYGWLKENLTPQLTESFGSVLNFEEEYQFDMHHVFGGPAPFDFEKLAQLRAEGVEITPKVVLDIPFLPVDREEDYEGIREQMDLYRNQLGRFCYVQTNGIFECTNAAFGIEDHLCWMAMYPEEIKELYQRLADWNIRFEHNVMDLGVDMVHISDDWGAQRGLLFSPQMHREMIVPALSRQVQEVKKRGKFLSLHSDGCIKDALPGIVEMGFDVLHPWQESAGMDYDCYLKHYREKFAILGGLCIQTTLGFGKYDFLKSEVQRVFETLKGKRWICCTTHYVQDHCSVDELVFCYDLVNRLAGKGKGRREGYSI